VAERFGALEPLGALPAEALREGGRARQGGLLSGARGARDARSRRSAGDLLEKGLQVVRGEAQRPRGQPAQVERLPHHPEGAAEPQPEPEVPVLPERELSPVSAGGQVGLAPEERRAMTGGSDLRLAVARGLEPQRSLRRAAAALDEERLAGRADAERPTGDERDLRMALEDRGLPREPFGVGEIARVLARHQRGARLGAAADQRWRQALGRLAKEPDTLVP